MNGVSKKKFNDRPSSDETFYAVVTIDNALNSNREFVRITKTAFKIGSGNDCDVRLNSPAVAPLVGECRQIEGARWTFVPVAVGGATLYGEPLEDGRVYDLTDEARFGVSELFEIAVKFAKNSEPTAKEKVAAYQERATAFAEAVHLRVLEYFNAESQLARIDGANVDDDSLSRVEKHIETCAENEGLFDPQNEGFLIFLAGSGVYEEIMSRFAGQRALFAERKNDERSYTRMSTATPRLEGELRNIATAIIKRLLKLDEKNASPDDLRKIDGKFWRYWFSRAPKDLRADFCRYLALRQLKKTLKDLLFGYGPLEDLLRTPTISEIMVVDYKTIFVEKNGVLENSGRKFFSDETTRDVIARIVARVHRKINASHPLVDARLRDGSRVNAIIAPIAVSGSCLTIRRFPLKRLTIDELVENPKIRSLTVAAAEFLRASILARKNILVSGGTGSGKTTLLNCLCDYIPDNERIVTIEDVAELQIKKRHVVRLESKPKNDEGAGEYAIRDLVNNALRMRPDRIVVGECRGGEALDMLQAMNTGHDGSLTTIHANSPKDAILRLETLAQMTPDVKLPVETLDRQIVAAVDLIVQLKRLKSGRRCVTEIAEVSEIDKETGEVVLRPIFASDGGRDSVLTPTGSLPTYIAELLEAGEIDAQRFYTI